MGRIVGLTDERNVRPGLRGEREKEKEREERREERKKKDRKEEREGRFEPVLIRC